VISVTADSNIYISGLIYTGPPRQFLDAARAWLFQLYLSLALLDEIRQSCGINSSGRKNASTI